MRTGEEPADEAAAREERQGNASELGAAVILGEGGEPDLRRAEPDAETHGEADDGHHTARLERAQDRPRMPLVRTPRADRRGERDERRPDTADHCRDAESENGRDGGGEQRDE